MGRQLYRSATKFIVGALSGLSANTETAAASVVSAVAQDPSEQQAVEKTLKVMVMQGHVIQTGEGPNATYRLAPSGQELLTAFGGA